MRIRKTNFFQFPCVKKPLKPIYIYIWFLFAKYMSDRLYLKLKYRRDLDMKLDLKNPKLFQEKLQWLKLNDRKDIYHDMVDKIEFKKFITNIIGEAYVIPTLAIFDEFKDINLNGLPKKFIMKNSHDSGSYFICNDKDKFDFKLAKNKLYKSLKRDYFIWSREWPYKGLKRRIIVEPLLEDQKGIFLTDYKFYTFNGIPRFFYITSNRGSKSGLCEDFFDMDGNLQEFNQFGYKGNVVTPSLPQNFQKMIEISKLLSKDTYHLRVDFYEVNGKLYVGELTFYDGGGFCRFTPEKYNKIFGDWIRLPIDN